MSDRIAHVARNFEKTVGYEIGYGQGEGEMVCNQFVVAVLRASVDRNFEYALADEFVQSPKLSVPTSPAPGDLVHWPGHIGVVLDPDQGTFIGSQSSTGVAISNYKKGWWGGEYGGRAPDYFLRWGR